MLLILASLHILWLFTFVLICWMYLILLVTLRSFNRLVLFISNWSTHVAISTPHCFLLYSFPFVVTCWIFVTLPLTLRNFNEPIFLYSNESLMLLILCLITCLVIIYLCFDLLNVSYSATHSSNFQPADTFHIQMKPSRCYPYASLFFLYFFRFLVTCWMFVILPLTLRSFNQPIVFVFKWNPHAANSCLITYFVIICLCFDLLDVSYSAIHSSKFQPADTFLIQMKLSCYHFNALLHIFLLLSL